MNTVLAFALAPFLVFAGCDALDGGTDSGGLIASQFVAVNVDQADFQGGLLVSDGEVDTHTFLAQVKEKMGEVGSVSLTRLIISKANGVSAGVAAWSDVYQGELVVIFVPLRGDPVQVAKVTPPGSGLDPLTTEILVDRTMLDRAPDIAAGRFAVRLQAGTPKTAADTFTLPLRVEMELIAF